MGDQRTFLSPERDMGVFAPGAAQSFAPGSVDEFADLYGELDGSATTTMVVGGGTHLGIGNPVLSGAVVSTEHLAAVIDHQPEDLTLTVEAGVTLGQIEDLLAPHRQTAALPETARHATIGGVIAAGISGYRRNRFGPTRDRILEVTVVTGDGRVVTGGARVVKNVSGYDLPRLATGSFGGMGVIVSVCLKLWPEPESTAMVAIERVEDANDVYRPLAVIETRRGVRAYIQGQRADVDRASEIGRVESQDLVWPAISKLGTVQLRIEPSLVADVVSQIPEPVAFIAQHGVGIVDVASEEPNIVVPLRERCEASGGRLVVTSRSGPLDSTPKIDPWGTPPAGIALQRRLIAGFDPRRIINRGRLPGGI